MSKLVKSFSLVLVLICLFSVEAQAGRKGRAHRTAQGLRSGEITRGEFRKIRKGERRIRRARKAANEDGQVTRKERAHIRAMKARQSGKIYRAKHNDNDRN